MQTCCSWPRYATSAVAAVCLLPCFAWLTLCQCCAFQANPSAAYGAWMKLHGKEEVCMGTGCPSHGQHLLMRSADLVSMPSQHAGGQLRAHQIIVHVCRPLLLSLMPSSPTLLSSTPTMQPTPHTRLVHMPAQLPCDQQQYQATLEKKAM
jgi:hypothetical protein